MLKATRFMRQPFFVSGHKVTEDNMDAIAKWCEGHVIRDTEKPFVRVPVDRFIHKRQTEAYVGTWVTVSLKHGQKSFKVYQEDLLLRDFLELPDDDIETSEPTTCCGGQSTADSILQAKVTAVANVSPHFRPAGV